MTEMLNLELVRTMAKNESAKLYNEKQVHPWISFFKNLGNYYWTMKENENLTYEELLEYIEKDSGPLARLMIQIHNYDQIIRREGHRHYSSSMFVGKDYGLHKWMTRWMFKFINKQTVDKVLSYRTTYNIMGSFLDIGLLDNQQNEMANLDKTYIECHKDLLDNLEVYLEALIEVEEVKEEEEVTSLKIDITKEQDDYEEPNREFTDLMEVLMDYFDQADEIDVTIFSEWQKIMITQEIIMNALPAVIDAYNQLARDESEL